MNAIMETISHLTIPFILKYISNKTDIVGIKIIQIAQIKILVRFFTLIVDTTYRA